MSPRLAMKAAEFEMIGFRNMMRDLSNQDCVKRRPWCKRACSKM